jgi:cell shape-determining protein MreD
MPLGFYAALFVIFYLLSASQKSLLANTRFSSYWLTFSVLLMTTYFIAYLMALVLNDVHLATLPLFLSAVACCTAFPLIYFPLYLLDDKLGGSERS